MRKGILSILGLLLIAVSFLVAKKIINSKSKVKFPPSKIVKTVFVDTVKNKNIPIVLSSNGTLVAKKRLELYAEVQGIFKPNSVLFKTGQKYNKGDILIRIDNSEYLASVQSAKSDLYNLVTSIMPDLKLDYPDMYDKWQNYLDNFDINKEVSQLPKPSTNKEKYFITGRGIYASFYNVKNLEKRLKKYTINAPFSGSLTEALVSEGTLIRPGQKLGEFIETKSYELEVSIEKEYADLLQEGNKVQLFNLNKTKSYTGLISRINSKVNQSSQTITTFIEVSHPSLKEGMYLEAYLNAKKEENAIEINRNLLQNGNQIFVVKDSILDIINVNPVFYSEKKVVIKGVPNDKVILSKPVPGAYAGMLVKAFQETKPKKNNSSSAMQSFSTVSN